MRLFISMLSLSVCGLANAGDTIVYKTDAYGRPKLSENHLVIHDDGTVDECDPYGRVLHSKGGYKIQKDGTVKKTDAYGREIKGSDGGWKIK